MSFSRKREKNPTGELSVSPGTKMAVPWFDSTTEIQRNIKTNPKMGGNA